MQHTQLHTEQVWSGTPYFTDPNTEEVFSLCPANYIQNKSGPEPPTLLIPTQKRCSLSAQLITYRTSPVRNPLLYWSQHRRGVLSLPSYYIQNKSGPEPPTLLIPTQKRCSLSAQLITYRTSPVRNPYFTDPNTEEVFSLCPANYIQNKSGPEPLLYWSQHRRGVLSLPSYKEMLKKVHLCLHSPVYCLTLWSTPSKRPVTSSQWPPGINGHSVKE